LFLTLYFKELIVESEAIDYPCQRNTALLIQRMRDTQLQIYKFIKHPNFDFSKRWAGMSHMFKVKKIIKIYSFFSGQCSDIAIFLNRSNIIHIIELNTLSTFPIQILLVLTLFLVLEVYYYLISLI
jgi:hypothetical protein